MARSAGSCSSPRTDRRPAPPHQQQRLPRRPLGGEGGVTVLTFMNPTPDNHQKRSLSFVLRAIRSPYRQAASLPRSAPVRRSRLRGSCSHFDRVFGHGCALVLSWTNIGSAFDDSLCTSWFIHAPDRRSRNHEEDVFWKGVHGYSDAARQIGWGPDGGIRCEEHSLRITWRGSSSSPYSRSCASCGC